MNQNIYMQPENAFCEWKNTHITSGFWQYYQDLILRVTLPIELEQMRRTGRLDSLKGIWKPGDPNMPHFFWDSDIAKWIEAVSYSLAIVDNSDLSAQVDEIIDRIAALQQEDGYFNTYYTLVEPGKRFTYVKRMHELYCLGHMIEAAVAYYRVSGKTKLLDVVIRYVELVNTIFGPAEEGKLPGYDGHEEIELALIKLYRITEDPAHLKLCRFFVHQRGLLPHFYEQECERRGEPVELRKYRDDMQGMYAYHQAHLPVVQQEKAVGHAVRATYLYCGMQDLAACEDDADLAEACRRIWKNIAETQLYVTGGIGPNPVGERFTYDYNLPNTMSYNETCASIGLFLFAARMLRSRPKGEYADVMERCLYNTIIGGVSLAGDRFYYANPLTVLPSDYENMNEMRPQVSVLRQEWFDVACCPPNLARLIMSLSGYIYSFHGSHIYVNLFAGSRTEWTVGAAKVFLQQTTGYPLEGLVLFSLVVSEPQELTIYVRIPAWSSESYTLVQDGEPMPHRVEDGYLLVRRVWEGETDFSLRLDMRPRVTQAHPKVAEDCGKVALERGPLVYCFEQIDNGDGLQDLRIDPLTVREEIYDKALLGGIIPLRVNARKRDLPGIHAQRLYQEWESRFEEVSLKAIPFYARYNRGGGEMIVWILNQDR